MIKIGTQCVKEHVERRTTKPHQLPIYATSSFQFENIEEGMDMFRDPSKGHLYSRFNNPTTDTVGEKIALLESHNTPVVDAWGIMTSSGMSAISTLLLSELKENDQILTQSNLYGGTTELINKVLPPLAIEPLWVNLQDLNQVEQHLSSNDRIKLIYFETPSNPALDCVDLRQIAEIAKKYDVLTVVDNTFCTPIIQQPFLYGIDYIIHSTTKYLNGHGNATSGIIIGTTEFRRNKVWAKMKLLGTNCSPWDAWLTNVGLKTLALRMKKHSENGLALSEYLSRHGKVASVNYLGLADHPFHELASRQMNLFGGMMCFEVRGGLKAGKKFMDFSKLGTMAPTMGDVDTLLMHPASMSHLNIPREVRLENGINDGLIRVSIGIEEVEDLIEDFDQALSQI